MARKFLYAVAALVVLAVAVSAALRLFPEPLARVALVPRAAFAAAPPLAPGAYAGADMWFSRPGVAGDPARWLPAGARRGAPVDAAVFFIHPTSYLGRDVWNAPLADAASRARAMLYVRGYASAFGDAREVWAPRYRQAVFGAFLTDAPAASQAIDLAYRDVLAAFDWFVAHAPADAPIVLAGHSQGALHLIRLLRDRVAGRPIARRVAAAYVVGWPVSITHDLPAMGLPACAAPGQSGCVLAWQSFAEPATPPTLRGGPAATVALDGRPRFDAPPLCSNPLTGARGGAAPASVDLGTLVPSADLASGTLTPRLVPARCAANGLLLIGPAPDLGPYVLPGNNYHVYDIPLFWANLRADFARRVAAWRAMRAH